MVFDFRRGGGALQPDHARLFSPTVGVVQLQFCPDPSGQLILLWSGYPASAMGRNRGRLPQRHGDARLLTLYSLIEVDAGATGYIA